MRVQIKKLQLSTLTEQLKLEQEIKQTVIN